MTPAQSAARIVAVGAMATITIVVVGRAGAETLNSIDGLKPGSRVAAYFYSREQVADLYAIGRHWDKKLGLQQDCKTPYNVQPVNLFLLKAIDFPEGKTHPVSGSWQHRFVFERCGKRMTYNAVFVARSGDKPEARAHVPGTTNASMMMVSDALKSASPAALIRVKRGKGGKECNEMELIDTQLKHPPRAATEKDKPEGHWEESWTFRGCGRDVELQVNFTPDGKGATTYSIKGEQ